jgi:DNA-binding FadR family transcriptional regulator
VPNQAHEAALAQLRSYLARAELSYGSRLPPERELCEMLRIPRQHLRKALAVLEQERQLWRHVGKGTFIGTRPLDTHADVAAIVRRTNPSEVMRTRLLLEPEVAAEAALRGTAAHISEMRVCLERARASTSWRQYETWDNRLHHVIAQATQNELLLALLDTLNCVRRTVTWGRLRRTEAGPPPDHHSFAEHEAVVDAIEDRDVEGARERMRIHLEHVERILLRQGVGDRTRPPGSRTTLRI